MKMEKSYKMTNKERFNELLLSTETVGMFDLIDHLEKISFYDAPASGGNHMAKDGGLLEHSLNVYDVAVSMISLNTFNTYVKYEDLVIASLLHDVGKAGCYDQPYYLENILKSGKRSDAKPFETNKEINLIQHQDSSVLIVSKFINLTYHQHVAIKYHNGLYTADGRDINGKETPLYLIIHFADMWASRFME